MRASLTLSAAKIALMLSSTFVLARDRALGWATWGSANALIELCTKTKVESGHSISSVFAPWPSSANRMQIELNSGCQLCDLLIGHRQWMVSRTPTASFLDWNATKSLLAPHRRRDCQTIGAGTVKLTSLMTKSKPQRWPRMSVYWSTPSRCNSPHRPKYIGIMSSILRPADWVRHR